MQVLKLNKTISSTSSNKFFVKPKNNQLNRTIHNLQYKNTYSQGINNGEYLYNKKSMYGLKTTLITVKQSKITNYEVIPKINKMNYSISKQPKIELSKNQKVLDVEKNLNISEFKKNQLTNSIINKDNEITNESSEIVIELVNKDIGLSKFLKDVYVFSGLGIGGSVMTSLILSGTGIGMSNPLILFGSGIIMSFASIYGIQKFKYVSRQENINNTIVEYSENDPKRILSYGGLITGMGITMAPLVAICTTISPTILPLSVLLSSFVFGGSSLFAYYKPNKSLLRYQAPLMGALTGFVGMGLLSIGSTLLLGPNMFSNIWLNVDMYGGILLFSGMTAYDTHKAIEMYESKKPDHLGCAVDFYLDFMNILIRVMEIMAKAKKN